MAVLACAASAHAGTVLRLMQSSAAPQDVVLSWASESPGPFTLLRREVPFSEHLADALPLDPVADAHLTGLTAGPIVLSGEAAPADGSTLVYQLADAGGACSNAGYVIRRPTMVRAEPLPPFQRLQPSTMVAWPRQSGLLDARAVLETWPEVVEIQRYDATTCGYERLVRQADGRIVGRSFALAGTTVDLRVSADVRLVLVGSSPPETGAQALEPATVACHPGYATMRLELPPATRWRRSAELLCGEEGVDWIPDAWGTPDRCTEGLWREGGSLSVSQFDALALGRFLEAAQRAFNGAFRLTGWPWRPQPGGGLILDWGRSAFNPTTFDPRDAGADPACRCADFDGDGADDCSEALDGTNPTDATSFGPDVDGDGVPDRSDACPWRADPAQADDDGDGQGDACDPCLGDPADDCLDPDGDDVEDPTDNCRLAPNADQANDDADPLGDACDPCPTRSSPTDDPDADGCPDWTDNCPRVANDQADGDADGVGDACDACLSAGPEPDRDSDGCQDGVDTCPALADDGVDLDGDGIGDACDCLPADASVNRPREPVLTLAPEPGWSVPWIALRWTRDPMFESWLGSSFDVVAGELSDLRAERGFSRAWCEASSLSEPQHFVRPMQAGSWYLVRERTSCAAGSYGRSLAPAALNARASLDAGLVACP